jgi:ABC-type amino acid transport substrate-binding protein
MRLIQIKHINRILSIIFAVMLAVLYVLPAAVFAEDSGQQTKTVRVGWHEVPYFITDENGRRSGYSYEYQRKLAAYTGWDYEYVEGTYSELLQKLMNGEIDMMSNVSYLDERAEMILYSSVPEGTESYYVFIAPDNTEIKSDDFSTLNGKRVGVAKGTFQRTEFLKWEEAHGVEADLIETGDTEEESLARLGSDFDAYVTMDVYADPEKAVPVVKVGSSDFYFAVSKNRPELLPELDEAMNRIQEENRYYNQDLHEKYLRSANADAYLSNSELECLKNHGTIRVGYQDNYLALRF